MKAEDKQSCDRAIKAVEKAFGLESGFVDNTLYRSHDMARARHVVCWLLADHTSISLADIGRSLGYCDHSSVHYGIYRVRAALAKSNGDEELRSTAAAALAIFNEGAT